MINNLSAALPQRGIAGADVIYEVLAEGGITRMLAVFSDIHDAGVLGSIRSIRPYYLEISRAYDAIVVHAGGSEQAYFDIPNKGIDNMDGVRGAYGGSIFYRDPNRMYSGYEHSLFTTSELIEEYTTIMKLRTEHESEIDYGFKFNLNATPEDGEPATAITVKFAGYKSSDFNYDEAEGVYYMTQFSKQYVDDNTKSAVGFTNVLVLYAETATIADEYSHLDVSLSGSGKGYFANGGKITPIEWQRKGDGAVFTYTNADGSQLEFGVGKTFICVVPNATSTGFSYS